MMVWYLTAGSSVMVGTAELSSAANAMGGIGLMRSPAAEVWTTWTSAENAERPPRAMPARIRASFLTGGFLLRVVILSGSLGSNEWGCLSGAHITAMPAATVNNYWLGENTPGARKFLSSFRAILLNP